MSLCSAFSPAPGGSTFDPANPGEIGGGTPNIGNFTRMVISGISITGADTEPAILDLSCHLNTTGAIKGLLYARVDNEASLYTGKLIDVGTVQEGSKFSVNLGGEVQSTYFRAYGFFYSPTFILGTSQVYMHALGSGELVLNGQNDADPLYKLVLGATQATSGTTVTIKAGDVTTGNGSDLSIEAGVGSVFDGVVNIGRTTSSRVGFFYANSSDQRNTSGGSASHATGTSGSPVYEDDLFDNYTIAQVVAALRAYGLLA